MKVNSKGIVQLDASDAPLPDDKKQFIQSKIELLHQENPSWDSDQLYAVANQYWEKKSTGDSKQEFERAKGRIVSKLNTLLNEIKPSKANDWFDIGDEDESGYYETYRDAIIEHCIDELSSIN